MDKLTKLEQLKALLHEAELIINEAERIIDTQSKQIDELKIKCGSSERLLKELQDVAVSERVIPARLDREIDIFLYGEIRVRDRAEGGK